ncbi:MAG: ribosome biogenesis GTPase Der [Nitrospinaceae bacterium]|jgi:GTP-binding protein|nr:MAG: ribosome biogenesis GTPase Der [Nitrospinaceae bacterium]
MPIPLVAIIGRANVGKSTLFNRLTERRTAIVHDTPGVTRDRIYGRAEWMGRPVRLVDTGGIVPAEQGEIEMRVQDQGRFAQAEADAIIFVADSQEGLTPLDREVIGQVRKSGKPLFLAINKVDSLQHEPLSYEFAALGIDPVYPLSAEHGTGVYELIEGLAEALPEPTDEEPEAGGVLRLAVIGRPNAGKSSLVNQWLNAERSIVSPIPGTTRDAIDSHLDVGDRSFLLVDTAGIRRKGKTRELLDKYSVIMALKAMDRCDVVVLVIDATEGVTDQDAAIAGYAENRGRAIVIAANKWDLMKGEEKAFEKFEEQVRMKLKFLDFAPVLAVSAKSGRGVPQILTRATEVYEEYSRTIPTGRLNECFEKAVRKNPMSHYRGKFMKLFYCAQVRTRPPTFRCFVNYPQGIHFSYRRYLINCLRDQFGFAGTPIRLIFSARDEKQR